MRVVACDPGCLGALALLDAGNLVDVADMPVVCVRRGKSDKREVDGYDLARLLREWAPDVGIIEQVGGMPGQASGASFNFGRAAGAPEYIMAALGIRMAPRVSPVTWKKRLGLKAGKDDARFAAMRLWPAMASRFARKKDDGRAEAGLIGHWYNLTNGVDNGVFG